MSRSIHEWIARGSVSEKLAKRLNYTELVRCKDCRWVVWLKNCRGEAMVICSNKESPVSETYRPVEPDWYCADGEGWEADEDNTP